ncbi:MAG: hypothetical protein HY656_03345 [Acidobacteria bacterium]|nr:hypothetical protein [Acidobacteriota bacterium]
MKESLGALGALGLGGVALSGCARPTTEPGPAPGRPWRDEKIFIFYYPPDSEKREPGRWVVDPAHKPVTPGRSVTWKLVGDAKKATLTLPSEVFVTTSLEIQRGNPLVTSKVKPEATAGFYAYEVDVDGMKAVGGSHPGVIVD